MTNQLEFPLVSWLSGFTRVYDTGGANFYIDCPVCGGRKKCGVHREKRLFHCFKCNEGGHGGRTWSGKSDLLGFVRVVENLSTRDARSFLNTLSGIPDMPTPTRATPLQDGVPDGRAVNSLIELHIARTFLKRRQIEHLAESVSFVERHELYSQRIIFPTSCLDKFTGFEARAVLDWMSPKALYPEWQDTLSLYTTRSWKGSGRIVITESLIDAETFHGIEDAVGSYGVFTSNQVESLLSLKPSSVVWAMDGDQNNRLQEFVSYTYGIVDTYILPFGPNEDPNSIGRAACKERLANAIKINTLWDLHDLAFN